MYGMLLESVMYFGRAEYGDEVWDVIKEHAGCRNAEFNTHQIYSDVIFGNLAKACAIVTDKGDENDHLRFFGRCFVKYCSHYNYDKMLRVTGRHFCQLLKEMDNLHSQMRFGFPKMKSPSMVVTDYDSKGAILQYRSCRPGLSHYLIGQLLQIAQDIFKLALNVEVLHEKTEHLSYCTTFKLEFDNVNFVSEMYQRRTSFDRPHLTHFTFGRLITLFPFGILVDPDLRVRLAGERILQMLGSEILDSEFQQHFTIQRPHITLSWETMKVFQSVTWEVESKKLPELSARNNRLNTVRDIPPRRGSSQAPWSTQQSSLRSFRGLLLKGQLYIIKDLDMALFLFMPLLNNLAEMQEAELYLNDLSMHDLSREMVLKGWDHCSRLQILYDRAEAYSEKLEEAHTLLEETKARGDDLLYSMLPRKLADVLRQGNSTHTTCQTFEEVTVMFAEVCLTPGSDSTLGAMDLLKAMNEIYNLLDHATDQYSVFKVETVGGVYMVVGGAPESRKDHCAQVAALALHMLGEVAATITHNLRIGIHVGPVAAGVVGLKLPRYCLFGDTVNTASRMQTNGKVGRIHVSEKCACALLKHHFYTTFRSKMQIKGKGEMNTYWLDGRAPSPTPTTPSITTTTPDEEEAGEDAMDCSGGEGEVGDRG